MALSYKKKQFFLKEEARLKETLLRPGLTPTQREATMIELQRVQAELGKPTTVHLVTTKTGGTALRTAVKKRGVVVFSDVEYKIETTPTEPTQAITPPPAKPTPQEAVSLATKAAEETFKMEEPVLAIEQIVKKPVPGGYELTTVWQPFKTLEEQEEYIRQQQRLQAFAIGVKTSAEPVAYFTTHFTTKLTPIDPFGIKTLASAMEGTIKGESPSQLRERQEKITEESLRWIGEAGEVHLGAAKPEKFFGKLVLESPVSQTGMLIGSGHVIGALGTQVAPMIGVKSYPIATKVLGMGLTGLMVGREAAKVIVMREVGQDTPSIVAEVSKDIIQVGAFGLGVKSGVMSATKMMQAKVPKFKPSKQLTRGKAVTEPKFGTTVSQLKTVGKSGKEVSAEVSALVEQSREVSGVTKGWTITPTGEVKPYAMIETGISYPMKEGTKAVSTPVIVMARQVKGEWVWETFTPTAIAEYPFPSTEEIGEVIDIKGTEFMPLKYKGATEWGVVATDQTFRPFVQAYEIKHISPVLSSSGGIGKIETGGFVPPPASVGMSELTKEYYKAVATPSFPFEATVFGMIARSATKPIKIKEEPLYIHPQVTKAVEDLGKTEVKAVPQVGIKQTVQTIGMKQNIGQMAKQTIGLKQATNQLSVIKQATSQATGMEQITKQATGLKQIVGQAIGTAQITKQAVGVKQATAQVTRQAVALKQIVKTVTPTVTTTTPPLIPSTSYIPKFRAYRPKKSYINIKNVLKSSKRASKILPTASLYNIEKTVKKFGKFSLPRGIVPEKMFLKGFEQRGVFMEFPTQQQLKRILRGGARSVARKKKKKK